MSTCRIVIGAGVIGHSVHRWSAIRQIVARARPRKALPDGLEAVSRYATERMRFREVAVAGLAHVLPDDVVTSEELETRLAPLYARHGLRVGRLELMTGIRERRFFARGTR